MLIQLAAGEISRSYSFHIHYFLITISFYRATRKMYALKNINKRRCKGKVRMESALIYNMRIIDCQSNGTILIAFQFIIWNDRVLTALVGVLFASINTYQRIIFIIFAKMIFLVENLLVSRDSITVFYLSKTISCVTWFPTSVWNEILVFSVTLILLTT